jgi:hypothetical protein
LKIGLRIKLCLLTPSFVSLINRRIETIGSLVALELDELKKQDTTKKLVSSKVSLKRLNTLHCNLNTLIEKAITNQRFITNFDNLCATYLELVEDLT